MRDWLISFRLYWTKVRYITVQFIHRSVVKPSVSVAKERAVRYWKYNWQRHHDNSAYTSIPSRFVVVSESQFTAADVLVSGAGTAAANGVYQFNASTNTYLSATGYYLFLAINLGNGNWTLFSPAATSLYTMTASAQPTYPNTPLGQWVGVTAGSSPAPQISSTPSAVNEPITAGKFHPMTSNTVSGNLPPSYA